MATPRSMGQLPVSLVGLHGWPIRSVSMAPRLVAIIHPLRIDTVAVQ